MAEIYLHPDQKTEIHKLPMVCLCGSTFEERDAERIRYDKYPNWTLERAFVELNDIGGYTSVTIDQWWGLASDVTFYQMTTENDFRSMKRRAFRIVVDSDDLRLALIAMFEYARERYQEWFGEPYDSERFAEATEGE